MKMLRDLPTTSLMVVAGGKIAFKYGDVTEVSYLASARKSILSMLFGNYVESGEIDLERTIGDLGIDDVGGLLPIERTATIANLLTARSGVYHPAASPGSDAKGAPARGSQRPGSYFYYNNWDFNVLGAMFEKLTGKTVFAAFQSDLAGPLQLQAGNYGQFILGLPRIDTVIVHRVAVTDKFAVARNLGTDHSSLKGVSAGEFLKIADAVLPARKPSIP